MGVFSPSLNKAVSHWYPKELIAALEIVHLLIYEMEASGKDANDYREEVASLPESIRRELHDFINVLHKKDYKWKINAMGVPINEQPFLDSTKLRKICDALMPVLSTNP